MFRNFFTLLISTLLAATAAAEEVPDIVIQYADTFTQSQAGNGLSDQLSPGRSLHEEYATWFFQGMTHPHNRISPGSSLMRDACARGQRWWREHPFERGRMMAQYGYTVVEREGVWSQGFEKSVFASGVAGEAGWWMTTLGGRAWNEVGLTQADRRAPATRVRIVGYLSPKGRYGHIGGYEREVLVTSAVRVEP
ncbi:hypothetical protein ACFFTM_11095 [Pseudoduganella plicata]|uniref:Uncharacterized protein n=1 Tax=Pseudoduganella plicata TaxID=321984 RepID=A0A4P7BBM4_9BURK|nr:hypothetical protein [Pseudoduganella plicata]QBQ36011.1 hypothetical protein E1742_07500 [Pseudoduganella plicata]GGY78741.1 hypothetical protein GCM10007388_09650 [Pseudoduganella plicata]